MGTTVVRMQQRRDTTARWTLINPILRAGEMGYNTDLDRFKMGDGSTAWADLNYLNVTLADVEAVTRSIVPDLVVEALAADDAPAEAAAAAVSAEIASRDLVQRSDPGIPSVKNVDLSGYIEIWRDATGRMNFGVKDDGTIRIFRATVDALTAGDAVLERIEPGGTGFAYVFRDSNGRASELAIGTDGRFPQWVIDAWATRIPGIDKTLAGGTGYSFVFRDSSGYASELAIGPDGRFAQHAVDGIASRMNTARLGNPPVDVIVASGQSNSMLRGTQVAQTAETDPRLLRWNTGSSVLQVIPATDLQWIGNEFGREYLRRTPGRMVCVVECGEGGTGFSTTSLNVPSIPAGKYHSDGGTWDRLQTSDPVQLYARMIARVVAAKAALVAAGYTVGRTIMLWSQGEADGPMTSAAYGAALDDLITQARADLGVADMPVMIMAMTPEFIASDANALKISKVHEDTPRRLVRTAYVAGPYGMAEISNAGFVHFVPQANGERARRAAVRLQDARLNALGGDPLAPQNIRVSRSGTTVTIAWDPPPARTTAYTIEVSDNGGSWTPLTLDGLIPLSATVTVAVDHTVRVRGKGTNETGTSNYSPEVAA